MSAGAPTDRQVQILRGDQKLDRGSRRRALDPPDRRTGRPVQQQLGRLEDRDLISRTGRRWRSCQLGT